MADNNQPIPLRARPTIYRGIQMRSRLEARYAAWLDGQVAEGHLHSWRYEPFCFAGGGGQYLPDFIFWMEKDGPWVFVEVKGQFDFDVWWRIHPTMEIIWESDPHALLLLWSPKQCHLASGPAWEDCGEEEFDGRHNWKRLPDRESWGPV